MVSFRQLFSFNKKEETSENSIFQGKVLNSQVRHDLAQQVSKANSSVINIESIIDAKKERNISNDKTEAELELEQLLSNNSLDKLLRSIEMAKSPEEIAAIIKEYEELLSGLEEKISILRSDKHLKEYLSIKAALAMLQQMNIEAIKGRQLAEILQNKLNSLQLSISEQARKMQAQSQKIHEQRLQIIKKLSDVEKALKASIEALQKDSGKLSPEELQAALKELQDSLKQIQNLKENALRGKLDLAKTLDILQKVREQTKQLIESGKLNEHALRTMEQLQQALNKTLQQANAMKHLQSDMNKVTTDFAKASIVANINIAASAGQSYIPPSPQAHYLQATVSNLSVQQSQNTNNTAWQAARLSLEANTKMASTQQSSAVQNHISNQYNQQSTTPAANTVIAQISRVQSTNQTARHEDVSWQSRVGQQSGSEQKITSSSFASNIAAENNVKESASKSAIASAIASATNSFADHIQKQNDATDMSVCVCNK